MSVKKPLVRAGLGLVVLGLVVLGPAGSAGAAPVGAATAAPAAGAAAPAEPTPLHTPLPAEITIPTLAAAATAACDPGGTNAGDTAAANALNPALTKDMRGNMSAYRASCARRVVQAVRERGLDRKAAVIAISAVIVETHLQNISEEIDHDSLGLFQQRASWGTAAQRLDPIWATNAFLSSMLSKYPNNSWMNANSDAEIGAVCQRVQVSAFPDRYATQVSDAKIIVDYLWTVSGGRPTGHVGHEVQDASGSWTGLRTLPGLAGAQYFDGPAVTVAGTPDGTSQVMAVGLNDLLYHNLRHADDGTWTGWRAVPGAGGAPNFAASVVTGAGLPDGSAQFLAVGKSNGLLYHTIRNADGTWTPWRSMPGAGGATNFAASKMSVAGLNDGTSQVIAIGINGLLYHNLRHIDGTWTGWQAMPGASGATSFGASDVAIANTTNGTTQVVAIGMNGLLYHNRRNADGTWAGWQAMPGNAGAANFGGPAVAIAGLPTGEARVTAIGITGGVYQNTHTNTGTWTDWTTVTTTKTLDIATTDTGQYTTQLVTITQ
jgi:hypothetical protein